MAQAEHEWFSEQIDALFGRGAQSAFARFLVAMGSGRTHGTTLRAINNYANGRAPLSSEMIALLTVLRSTPKVIEAMIREAVGNTRQNF